MDSIIGKLKPDPDVSHEQFKVSHKNFRFLKKRICIKIVSDTVVQIGGLTE